MNTAASFKSELSLSELFMYMKKYNILHPTTLGKEAFFRISKEIAEKGSRFMLDKRNKNRNMLFEKLSNLIIKNEIDLDKLLVKTKYTRMEAKKMLTFLKVSERDMEDFLSTLDPFYYDVIYTEKLKQVFSTEIIEGKMKYFGRPNYIISQLNAKISRTVKVKLLQKMFNEDHMGLGFLDEASFVKCFMELNENIEENIIRELFNLMSESVDEKKMMNINFFCKKLLTHSEQFELTRLYDSLAKLKNTLRFRLIGLEKMFIDNETEFKGKEVQNLICSKEFFGDKINNLKITG